MSNDGMIPVEPTYEELKKRVLELEGTIRDQEQAQEASRYSEHKYRRLFELASDALFLIDKDSGRILDVNHAASEMYGYKREELLELRKTDLLAEPAAAAEATQNELLTGPVLYHKKKNGSIFPVEISASHLDWGGFKAHIAAVRDITERVKIKKRLLQSQKMEAIGTFAGGIAHDFNNILSVILGYAELAMMETAEDSELHNDLQNLYGAGMRARDLVMQILTFSRQTEQKTQAVQINLIVKETLKFLRSSLPSSIQIHSTINSDGKVLADPTQIHQVLMNLSSNAMHAMRSNGGVMEVCLDEVRPDKNFKASNPEAVVDTYLKLAVTDNGEGISSEMIEKIFDPFFTTKGKEEGTGLGLSVVHSIVKSCDGFINVSSWPGQGSVFNVFLPLIEATTKTSGEIKGTLPTGTERLLLVDDDKSLADIEKQKLKHLGYHVTASTSSIEALELFKARPDHFDLVITDLTMPNMNGDRLVEELIAIKSTIPVIVCSGFNKMIDEKRFRTLGIKGLLLKPVTWTDLALMVRKVLDKARTPS